MGSTKWLTIDVNTYIVWEWQGFFCNSNTIKAQDICLNTEKNPVILKYIPMKPLKMYSYILEKDVFVREPFVMSYL